MASLTLIFTRSVEIRTKVPTDLVKISVKEATHMGFHYNTSRRQGQPLQFAPKIQAVIHAAI